MEFILQRPITGFSLFVFLSFLAIWLIAKVRRLAKVCHEILILKSFYNLQ